MSNKWIIKLHKEHSRTFKVGDRVKFKYKGCQHKLGIITNRIITNQIKRGLYEVKTNIDADSRIYNSEHLILDNCISDPPLPLQPGTLVEVNIEDHYHEIRETKRGRIIGETIKGRFKSSGNDRLYVISYDDGSTEHVLPWHVFVHNLEE